MIDEILGHFRGRRITGTESAIDLDQSFRTGYYFIHGQGFTNGVRAVSIHIKKAELNYTRIVNLIQNILADEFPCQGNTFPGFRMGQGGGKPLAQKFILADGDMGQTCCLKLLQGSL